MHDTVKPILYQDPIIEDYRAFLNTILESPESLQHVRRLRLCHGDQIDPAAYWRLLEGAGHLKLRRFSHVAAEMSNMKMVAAQLSRQYKVDLEAARSEDKGRDATGDKEKGKEKQKEIMDSLDDKENKPTSPKLLPTLALRKLEKVVIQPNLSAEWDSFPSRSATDPHAYTESLSVFLVNYPTVQHFCQPRLFTALTLPNGIIKLTHPPKVFTTHIRTRSEQNHYGRYYLRYFNFPVILGAVNRFMFELPMLEFGTPFVANNVRRQLRDIIYWTTHGDATVFNTHENSAKVSRRPIQQPWLAETRVELYGLVAVPLQPTCRPVANFTTLASAVEQVQAVLEDMLSHGRYGERKEWEGKVVVKTAKEAPPCTACGRVLGEHCLHLRKDVVRTKWTEI